MNLTKKLESVLERGLKHSWKSRKCWVTSIFSFSNNGFQKASFLGLWGNGRNEFNIPQNLLNLKSNTTSDWLPQTVWPIRSCVAFSLFSPYILILTHWRKKR